jgi:hypothetical protein
MQRSTTLRLFPVLALLACDVPEDASEREDDDSDAIAFRTGPSTTGGSIRLNTAKLFDEGLPLRHFKKNGSPVGYDDAKSTQVTFLRIELAASAGVFEAASHNIQFDAGRVRIDGALLQPGELLGSRWRYTLADSTHGPRNINLQVTGVGIATVPGGLELPLYNFSLAGPATSYYDNGPHSACDRLDLQSTGVVTQLADMTPPGEVNLFDLEYSAVLYGDVRVSELGTVTSDATVATVACVSGAVGKAGLWGYPPWVSMYLSRTGVQQLQAATRAIRADFCGDGVSHTKDGTPLQIRDRFTSMFADPIEATESVWTTNRSACRVTADRLDSGATYTCGGTLMNSCDKSAADWLNGPDQFMWIKVDPDMTPLAPTHACNVNSPVPGCSDPGIEATVCADVPACCTSAWGPICVSKVTTLVASADACCAANGGPGCGDAAVSACVGALDPSCTTSNWDSLCAQEVELLGCGVCH